MSADVVLTSDRGTFTDYNGASPLGYVACLPARLVPRLFMNKFFTPPIAADNRFEAEIAPYPLRKLEAILEKENITVSVTPPEVLERAVDSNTKILGINVHDPYGLSPVTSKLTMIFGGGESWTSKFFSELSETVVELKEKYHFKVVIGGAAAWQIELNRPDWVDSVFEGEAELDFPLLVRKMMSGNEFPRHLQGRMPKVDQIPVITKPTRFGEVQITRGCPRGCQFCPITPETFRSIPLDDILREVKLNLDHGIKGVELLTDDIMLYGSRRLEVNHEALINLFKGVKNLGATHIYFPHITAPGVKSSPRTVEEISHIAEYDKYVAEAPVVGLESGSERIIGKYMRGKTYPWTPHEWGDIIYDATGIMVDNGIHPCYTVTIGYPDETESDMNETLSIINRIADGNLEAWVFPLPVIPMTPSRLKGNTFPKFETIPDRYWDILYASWRHSIKVTRDLLPLLTTEMPNPIIKWIVQNMNERVFSGVENIFKELADTRGKAALGFSKMEFNSALGIIRALYYLGTLGINEFIKNHQISGGKGKVSDY